jgi:hypothetical protein
MFMTHTSQRRGLDSSRPGEELIVLAITPSAYRSKEGIREAVNELAVMLLKHGRNHWPEWTNDRLADIPNGSFPGTMAAAFTEVRKVENLLNDLKKEWLPRNKEKGYPISIVLTGLTDDVHAICEKTGFKENTYLHSLGFFGRTEELPSDDEMCLITMCGHGLIARNRIENLLRALRDGELTLEEAAADIALPCSCGIGNKERAEKIFTRLSNKA